MPRSTNNRRGEQWDECAISGFNYPVSETIVQRGHRVSVEHSDKVPNADFYRANFDIMENVEAEERILPAGPLEEIAP